MFTIMENIVHCDSYAASRSKDDHGYDDGGMSQAHRRHYLAHRFHANLIQGIFPHSHPALHLMPSELHETTRSSASYHPETSKSSSLRDAHLHNAHSESSLRVRCFLRSLVVRNVKLRLLSLGLECACCEVLLWTSGVKGIR